MISPTNTQLVFVNQTNGQANTVGSTTVAMGGTATLTLPTAGITPYGAYYLKAWDATSHAYYAQTVVFYLSDPNGGGDGL